VEVKRLVVPFMRLSILSKNIHKEKREKIVERQVSKNNKRRGVKREQQSQVPVVHTYNPNY
jgi:hypothetical protein